MTDDYFRSIVFPTDFSPQSGAAFAHALRIAVAARGFLHLLHIGGAGEPHDWSQFPQVRETLAAWGMIEAGVSEEAVAAQLGCDIRKAHVKAHDPVNGIRSYLELHRCDLLILATHASALQRLLLGSTAEAAAQAAGTPALFLRDGQKGFVDAGTGEMRLRLVLMAVDSTDAAEPAYLWLSRAAARLDPACRIRLLHVGEAAPRLGLSAPAVELRHGPVAETIIDHAREIGADLIAMPTSGLQGWTQALKGSVSAKVIHGADQPVLVIPAEALGG